MSARLVIVEGIDHSGKSTLAALLGSALGCRVYRKTVPPTLTEDDFHASFRGVGWALADLVGMWGESLVVDRSFISDFVYRHGAGIALVDVWLEWEERLAAISSTCIVYVETSQAEIRRRLGQDPDPYLDDDLVGVHMARYEEYLAASTLPVIRVSGERTQIGDVEETIGTIMEVLCGGR